MTVEPRHAAVQYPGGLRATYRWAGSGQGEAVFALTAAGGTLDDHGALAGSDPDRLCRAELRVEGPIATWTVRLASPIFDDPSGFVWDTAGLLVVKFGFLTYAFAARSGELRWTHRSRTPILAALGSSRIEHVLSQSELETFAIDAGGEVIWRVGHSDVVVDARLVGGRLVLTSFTGQTLALDPETGREAG